MQELQEEFGPKGLVVLALSDEEPAKVERYVEELGLGDLRVAAGSQAARAYGVQGLPSTRLLSPEGAIVWEGHPRSLTAGDVEKALEGARPAPAGGFLAFRPAGEYSEELSGLVEAAEAGELGKALAGAAKRIAMPNAEAGVVEEAKAFQGEVTEYVELLGTQVARMVEERNILPALDAYGILATELRGTEVGAGFAERLEKIEADEALMNEAEAAKALARANELAARRGKKKAKQKFEDVVEKFPGTKAAERAGDILRKL